MYAQAMMNLTKMTIMLLSITRSQGCFAPLVMTDLSSGPVSSGFSLRTITVPSGLLWPAIRPPAGLSPLCAAVRGAALAAGRWSWRPELRLSERPSPAPPLLQGLSCTASRRLDSVAPLQWRVSDGDSPSLKGSFHGPACHLFSSWIQRLLHLAFAFVAICL
jgi:hypothetical protein